MSRPRIVAFAGSLHRPSRTRALLEAIGAEVARGLHADLRVFDLVDAGPGLAGSFDRATLTLPARRIVDAIESADALIVGSPVYKGSYTGLFKHVFDLVEPDRLAGKPVVLAASGGGPRHALVVEHALRPLFGFFTALTIPTAVYAADGEIVARSGRPRLCGRRRGSRKAHLRRGETARAASRSSPRRDRHGRTSRRIPHPEPDR